MYATNLFLQLLDNHLRFQHTHCHHLYHNPNPNQKNLQHSLAMSGQRGPPSRWGDLWIEWPNPSFGYKIKLPPEQHENYVKYIINIKHGWQSTMWICCIDGKRSKSYLDWHVGDIKWMWYCRVNMNYKYFKGNIKNLYYSDLGTKCWTHPSIRLQVSKYWVHGGSVLYGHGYIYII